MLSELSFRSTAKSVLHLSDIIVDGRRVRTDEDHCRPAFTYLLTLRSFERTLSKGSLVLKGPSVYTVLTCGNQPVLCAEK